MNKQSAEDFIKEFEAELAEDDLKEFLDNGD